MFKITATYPRFGNRDEFIGTSTHEWGNYVYETEQLAGRIAASLQQECSEAGGEVSFEVIDAATGKRVQFTTATTNDWSEEDIPF